MMNRKTLAALILLLLPFAASAQSSLPLLGVGGGSAAAGYTGPCDVVACQFAVGFQAGTTAFADGTHNAVQVKRASDSVVCNFLFNTSGQVGVSGAGCSAGVGITLTTFLTSTSGTIPTFYDSSGNGKDFTSLSGSTFPTVVLNCQNSQPCASFNGTTDGLANFSVPNVSVRTYTLVGERSGNFTSRMQAVESGGDNSLFGYFNSANTVELQSNFSGGTVTASDSAWHTLQALVGASGQINVDGTDHAIASGLPGSTTQYSVGINTNKTVFCACQIGFASMSTTASTAGNRTAIHGQEVSFWAVP